MTVLASSPEMLGGERQTPRVMVVWCPDWPVVAAAARRGLGEERPLAVLEKGQVYACSALARTEGVRRGMTRRDAAARCPELVVLDRTPEHELQTFEVVLSAMEDLAAGIAPLRPGLCALGVPSRFYGGERQAAAVVGEQLVAAGVWDCRIGIADGIFAAEQAARQASVQECRIVEPGGSAAFLATLSIAVLDDDELIGLLRRLGIRSLGSFAELAPRDVSTRFGARGAWLHRLARGLDIRPAVARRPPLDIDQRVDFTPPLELIEPIVFSCRQAAERCVAELARHGLVCTQVRIEVITEGGWTGGRVWAHSRWFSAADLIDRVYWQLQADPAPEPVSEIRLLPEAVESLADHGEGLWGNAFDEHVERGIARLQGMLGPEEVLAPSLQGGRGPRQRQRLTPWGEQAPRRAAGRDPSGHTLPWPGSIPPPAPAQVFAEPQPAVVLDEARRPVAVSDRGLLTAPPAWLGAGSGPLSRVEAWAGPWPIDELWWDPANARQVARFQLVTPDGEALLLMVEDGHWWTEARYA